TALAGPGPLPSALYPSAGIHLLSVACPDGVHDANTVPPAEEKTPSRAAAEGECPEPPDAPEDGDWPEGETVGPGVASADLRSASSECRTSVSLSGRPPGPNA